MTPFAALFAALDSTTSTAAKTTALAEYFQSAPEPDRVWTVALLSGRRPRRAATSTELRLWAGEAAGLPPWLVEESYALIGDLAETIALILPTAPAPGPAPSLADTLTLLSRLPGQPTEARRAAILAAWTTLPPTERFLFNKLLTGGFRMGVAQGLMTRALARASGQPEAQVAQALMGDWDPATTPFATLTGTARTAGPDARPYPFALASPLEDPPETLGDPADWQAEWKWDGIRAQIVARPGAFAIWSRGEDLVTARFPELSPLADHLPPGTVIDGELLAWDAATQAPLPFAALQTRLGRKTVPRRLLAEAPVRLIAYDLLETDGQDLRSAPFATRRAALEALIARLPLLPLSASPLLPIPDWTGLALTRTQARDARAEGLMLKRAASPYLGGRKRGDWWKWKLDPFSADMVMLYAQAGHGRRAGLYTDYTFAVRDGEALVPVAKAYSGLTDAEFTEITRWVNAHTLERFGPVRRVPPDLVFEVAFEGIQPSPRHKAGLALRFPRMLRWRRDKPAAEIDTLDSLRALMNQTNHLRGPGSPV
ncbi:ATP-dependent DNA ligase [Neotabrizicola shimadae]|uniref:DNA ligase (ATP) n=1 Tax=Neotabrizicola shimadae TaxID=2807096 RepID=A0A8G1EEM2_9RHOB|nr:ATP-dependent DNA ligase [Neotabrizicola shimadae]QYZ71546.1 ATP-dependent DNA ligase [Neotabrizicola shimadae]